MANRQKLVHLHSSGATFPAFNNVVDELEYGEIAVAYKAESPTLLIKDTEDNLADFIDRKAIEAYTVNGKALVYSGTPVVLDGRDIKLDEYEMADEYYPIESADTVNIAIGKLEKALELAGGLLNVSGNTSEPVSGLTVQVDQVSGKVQTPIVVIETGEVVSGDTRLVNGGIVYDAIKFAFDELDCADSAITGQVVKSVSEEDGVITVTHDFLLDSEIKLMRITPDSSVTYASQYILVNGDGVQLGDTIDVLKDQFLKRVDFYINASAATEAGHDDYPVDLEFPALRFEWAILSESGETSVTWVSVRHLVDIYDAASGVGITNNVLHGVVDPESEDFLTVGVDGFKLDGVQEAIDNAYYSACTYTDESIANLNSVVGEDYVEEGYHVAVQVVQVAGKLSALTVSEYDIASLSALTYEIRARRRVDGIDGDYYMPNLEAYYISGATSLNDADLLLDAAIKAVDEEAVKSVTIASGCSSGVILDNVDPQNPVFDFTELVIDCGGF